MGVVKSTVFQNLLSCMDVELTSSDYSFCQQKYGLIFEGVSYLRYESILKLIQFDNHADRWTLSNIKHVSETTSVISGQVRRL